MFCFLKQLQRVQNVVVLTPSLEVACQYAKEGIYVKNIQLGIIPMTKQMKFITEHNDALAEYYGGIITTCGSDNDVYKFVKGIDRFYELVKELGCTDMALVAGCS